MRPYDWMRYRQMREANPGAAERGRLVAAQEIATNPEARLRVEAAIGVDACRQMYPECYGNNGRFSGVVRFLDRVRAAIPW